MLATQEIMLREHALFRHLNKKLVERILSISSIRHLKKGEVLFVKDEAGDALYGVLAGRIRISNRSLEGQELILKIMEKSDIFGEIALLDGSPRTADAVASEDSQLLMIRHRDFTLLLQQEPMLALQMIRLLCERVRQSNEYIEDLTFLDISRRLAKHLLNASREGEKMDEGIRLPLLSHDELAQRLGTTRTEVTKQLHYWRDNGWLLLEKGQITLCDARALQKFINSRADMW
ncbi:Crp/Fnr family transcriptional regulator [Beggiatoa leptomitoformis]|uniref:Cyclic nucleotide-binding domain-containing protein n=1 Tax=Beggiatoa leptomitoformis TaxID=288004 RepID=A0A2N9YAX4_9GAMM|nr:Crp/Fnr family transcriptional regulator [Beggiatoa leptomitoformis]ALG67030.1 cyclic nucleotide-binding domain-containing protein [Beggiatoa leptomitoformis]AUI67592.1 cyclic nucleotide-binding domain-containing protein [Beggiatoa leptomitoformis]